MEEDAADDIQITGIEVHTYDPNAAGISPISNNDGSQWGEAFYNLTGTRTNGLTRGINIVRGQDGRTRKVAVGR